MRVGLGSGFVRESLVEGKRILIEKKTMIVGCRKGKRILIERKQSSFLFSFLAVGCRECDDTLCLGGYIDKMIFFYNNLFQCLVLNVGCWGIWQG